MAGDYEKMLRDALAHVDGYGFGENVDADSIIEEAAKAHLRYLETERTLKQAT